MKIIRMCTKLIPNYVHKSSIYNNEKSEKQVLNRGLVQRIYEVILRLKSSFKRIIVMI